MQPATTNFPDIGYPITVFGWFPWLYHNFPMWTCCRKLGEQFLQSHFSCTEGESKSLKFSMVTASVGFWYNLHLLFLFLSKLFCKFKSTDSQMCLVSLLWTVILDVVILLPVAPLYDHHSLFPLCRHRNRACCTDFCSYHAPFSTVPDGFTSISIFII